MLYPKTRSYFIFCHNDATSNDNAEANDDDDTNPKHNVEDGANHSRDRYYWL